MRHIGWMSETGRRRKNNNMNRMAEDKCYVNERGRESECVILKEFREIIV